MAQLLTTPRQTQDRARRATGLGLIAGAGGLAAAGLSIASTGILRLAWAAAATALVVLALAKLLEGDYHRRLAEAEVALLAGLISRLPAQWYVLGDLEIEPSWLEPVRVWAVVVGPGGVAVVQPCAEAGDLTPCGHVWMVTQGKRIRTIPSPGAQACTAAEALKEILGTEMIPVVPVVALTNLDAVYHRAEMGAEVVGAPHVGDGLRIRLGGGRRIWDSLQLAAFLSQYHRQS